MAENRIVRHFREAREAGRKSLVLFLSGGFPDMETTERLIPVLAESGCDVLELGVPFSDPIADGPTIQVASTEALRAGASLEKLLGLVGKLRGRGIEMPILLFGAFNPFLHYGLERLTARAAELGVDGFLIPDLPVEESGEVEAACAEQGLSLIQLVAPTTPPERMDRIVAHAGGFLYFISLKGVTGTEIRVDEALRKRVGLLREKAGGLPIVVGFGVSTAEQAEEVARVADGVVVGSALIRLVDKHRDAEDLEQRVGDYVRELKAAL